MAISLDVKPTHAAREGKKRYHVGVVEGGPVWSIALGGVVFPVHTIRLNHLKHEVPSPGAYCWLSDEDKERVLKAAKNKIVRWVKRADSGEVVKADVYDKETMGFEPEPTDIPLGEYLYMEESPETTPVTIAASVQKLIEGDLEAAKKSEEKVANDPRDAKTRELHGKLKKTGAPVPHEGDL